MSSYLPSSSGWASQKYLPASTGYSSHAGTGSLRVVLDRSYDAAANRSALTVRLQGRSETYSGTFRVRQGGTLKVNGSTVQTFEQGSTGSTHFLVTDKDDTWRTVTRGTQSAASWSVTLPHDGNGRLTVTVETDFYLYYTVGGTSYVMRFVNSGSVTFTEPRGSAIASLTASASTQGVIGLTVNRYDGSYTHTAAFTCGGRTLAVSERFGTSLSQSVPRAWFDAFPDADRLSVTVSVQTYSGAAAIGEPATGTVAVTADAGMAPALAEGFVSAAPLNDGTAAAAIAGYVQRFSRARLTLDKSKVTLCNGARLASYTVTCRGERQTVASPGALETVDTAVLTAEGDTALTVTATDSRGRSASRTLTVAVMACAPPTLSAVQVFRCLSDGTASDDGTCYAAKATAGCSPLGGQNSVQSLTARAAQGSGGYGLAAALTSGALTVVPAGLDPDQRAQILLTVTDALGESAETVVTLPGRKWALKFRADGQGAAFGRAPTGTKALELPEDWSIMNGTETRLPILMGTAAEASNAAVVRAALGLASGTSNGWTYYRIGTICFAWYYKQLTGVNITASWSGLYYRSGEIEAAPYPTFLANGYKFSAALAGGSQNGGVTLGRIMNSNSALRVFLMATGSVTNANCAVMVFAMGTWKE